MKKENILYGVIGLLGGAIIAVFAATTAVNSNNQGMMNMMGMHTNSSSQDTMNDNDMDMSMNDMTSSLKDKTDDDFDKAFISEMIIHHQGAIDMATLAKQNAKHNEIKNLADAIIIAQTKEISEMQSWQEQWNYPSSSMQMMHGSHQNERARTPTYGTFSRQTYRAQSWYVQKEVLAITRDDRSGAGVLADCPKLV